MEEKKSPTVHSCLWDVQKWRSKKTRKTTKNKRQTSKTLK